MPKERKAYSVAISYESDTEPVETVRTAIEVVGMRQAVRQASREACSAWPKSRRFRSVVVVVEQKGQD